jgi:predicted Zn-dependent peptidase
MNLLEERLADAKADIETYNNLSADILKRRANAKLDQYANFNQLANYAAWGPKSPSTNILTEAELKTLDPEELVQRTKNLKNIERQILYYGPLSANEIIQIINDNHAVGATLRPVPAPVQFVEQETAEDKVLLAHYDSKQIYMSMRHKGGGFDKSIEPIRNLYNSYFGSGINSLVFQEIREARGLAYSASAGYNRPGRPDLSYMLSTFIATQNDKMMDAIDAFNSILHDMPESEQAFELAKESLLTNIQTERIIRDEILWNYLTAQRFGYDTDFRKELYDKLHNMTLKDIKDFQTAYVKNKPMTYCILGDANDLDLDALRKIGTLTILSQEEIYGY